MAIEIITLSPTRWKEYKNLRLEAVENEDIAMIGTVEEESAYPEKLWKDRLENAMLGRSYALFAEHDGKLVGMLAAIWDTKEKIRHVANLVSVYVSPEYRGKGIGKMLLEEMIAKLKLNPQIKKVKLSVASTQAPALGLYEKMGFKNVGKLSKEVFVNGEYFDEYIMELEV